MAGEHLHGQSGPANETRWATTVPQPFQPRSVSTLLMKRPADGEWNEKKELHKFISVEPTVQTQEHDENIEEYKKIDHKGTMESPLPQPMIGGHSYSTRPSEEQFKGSPLDKVAMMEEKCSCSQRSQGPSSEDMVLILPAADHLRLN